MNSHWLLLASLVLFLQKSEQITDVTAFSDFSYLPTCVQEVMTETGVLGLQGQVCTPWKCVCSNEAVATSSASNLISIVCVGQTEDITKGVEFVTSFCSQIDNPLPISTTLTSTKTNQGVFLMSIHSCSFWKEIVTITTTDANGQVTTFQTIVAFNPGASSGLSQSDKIALGCGIGIGLPATLAALYMCFYGKAICGGNKLC